MKYLICLIIIVTFSAFFYIREVEINSKWDENLLIGLTKTEVISFLGLPDEIDMGKQYLAWFDTRNNQTLTVSLSYLFDDYELVQKMDINDSEKYKLRHSFKDEYFIVKSLWIKKSSFKIRCVNRNKALKKLLKYHKDNKDNKNKLNNYSYFK